MELTDHIRKISFVFFVLIGIPHFIAGFFYVNGYSVNLAGIINRALFIPFVISAFTYFASNNIFNRIQNGNSSRNAIYIYLTIGILILGGLIALEVIIPDSSVILLPSS